MGDTAKTFFTETELEDIRQAVMNAELDTSGEIRVHIENKCAGDVLQRATRVFNKLGMQKTELRNGILFYLAVQNRKYAVIGDKGINDVVDPLYWERLKSRMADHFRESRFSLGLVEAITETGLVLKEHFPYMTGDVNELPDDLTFDDN